METLGIDTIQPVTSSVLVVTSTNFLEGKSTFILEGFFFVNEWL